MKIKSSFTTNSSSSSFVCWGVSKDDLPEIGDDAWLKSFNEHLLEYKDDLKNDPTSSWVTKYVPTYIKDMEELETDEDRIEYAKDHEMLDESEYPNPISCGGPGDGDKFVGICPTDIEKNFPDVKFGEVKKFVAEKINEVLGTKLIEKDISYYEEGWMDN